MTLIELLAGLVVLGTVLASVSIARGRFLRQWGDAERKIQATRAADAMLSRWFSGPVERIPAVGQGTLRGMKQHAWRTVIRRDPAVEAMGAIIVQLQVFDQSDSNDTPRKPVMMLEFLLPRIEEARP